MKLAVLHLILSFFIVSSCAYSIVKDQVWLKNYFSEIKKTYDKRVAPTDENNPGSPIKVAISLYILDISDVNDDSMDYSAQFYFRQAWNDSRLRFTDRTDVITMRSAEDIWIPDLFFTSGRYGRLESIVQSNAFLKINPNGEVFYSIRITVVFSCPMDLSYFPHDIQKCVITVESYAHTKQDIDIVWTDRHDPIGAGNMTLHNFDLTALHESEKTSTFTFGQYKTLSVSLTFQRKFGFFAIKLYVPYILLVCLSFLSLWIKAEERSLRMAFLVIILFIMLSICWEIRTSIPPAPYTKGSDVWIGFCKSLVFAIFLEFVAVALISGRHKSETPESKGEILLNMESDSKEQSMKADSLKSHLCKFVNMFDARSGGKGKRNESAYRIDRIFRLVFPLIFILFNIVYWPVYCCKSTE